MLEPTKTGVKKSISQSTRMVKITYNGISMLAVAISFVSGAYYMEKYYLLQDGNIGLEYGDFDSIVGMNPSELFNSKM